MYLLLLAVFVLAWLYLRRREKLAEFDGPIAWPLVGNLPQIDGAVIQQTFARWAKQYGGICKVNLFGDQALVVSDPKLFHDMLVTRGSEFSERAEVHEGWWFSQGGQDMVYCQPTPTWRALRKLGHASMKVYDKGLERIELISMEMIQDMFDTFSSRKGQPFDPKPLLSHFTMNIITILFVGKSYEPDSEMCKTIRAFEVATWDLLSNKVSGAIMDMLPWLRPFYDLLGKLGKKQQETMRALYEVVTEEARRSEQEGFDQSLATILKNAVDRSEITEVNAALACSNVILGGTATTTNTLHAYVNILIHHPDIQQRLQQEVDDVVGNRHVSLADREKLPYHQATQLELLRYTSVVPDGLAHRSNADTKVAGKSVPAKTTIFFSLYGLQHDEDLYPEPFSFKPQRFLDDQGDVYPADHPQRNYFAFGSGPRVCFGESLAKSRLFLVLASLSQRFDVLGDNTRELVPFDARHYVCRGLLFSPDYRVRMMDRNK